MKFNICHDTYYEYSLPVWLEKHSLRFRPRESAIQKLTSFDQVVVPIPAICSHSLDRFDNSVSECWFDDKTSRLEVNVKMEVETHRLNPFDFIDESKSFQKSASVDVLDELIGNAVENQEVSLFEVAQKVNHFLFQTLDVVIREDEGFQVPEETVTKNSGACRDLSILYCALMRRIGLESRFVSGYQVPDLGESNIHLHAWSEVYFEQGGWRGFDPSHGIMVADRHIAVACGMTTNQVAPIEGNFRKTGATSKFDSKISIEVSPI